MAVRYTTSRHDNSPPLPDNVLFPEDFVRLVSVQFLGGTCDMLNRLFHDVCFVLFPVKTMVRRRQLASSYTYLAILVL